MRRADRLFQLVQLLRSHRLVTAARMARELEISERTVYRDLRDLSLNGVPIRGEAGVGYTLGRGFELPPLMFDEDELQALLLGARMVQGHADPALARAAASAISKVELVVPEGLRPQLAASHLLVPAQMRRQGGQPEALPHLRTLREAIHSRRRVTFHYRDARGTESRRRVRPLALAFWGRVWSLASWCESRQDFRSFRLDRMARVAAGASFPQEPARDLDAFIQHVTREIAQRRQRAS